MHITLFGSSFNPPHLGHALVVQDFLSQNLTDELWLLPTNQHTFGKSLAPTHHRLAMTKIFLEFLHSTIHDRFILSETEGRSTIKLCSIEIDLDLSGQTIDTLDALQNTDYISTKMDTEFSNLNSEFSFLMGSDQLPHFDRWGQWQRLLEQMKFYAYPRAGYNNQPLKQNMQLVEFKGQTITNLSSSLTRARLSSNLTTANILPEPIHTYIKNNNLYLNSEL